MIEFQVGDRVRIPCQPPYGDMTGTVGEIRRQPWGNEYLIYFGWQNPVLLWAWVTFGVAAVREDTDDDD